jgi:hypothetical protein
MRNRAAHTNSNQTRWHVPMVRKTKGGQVMAIRRKCNGCEEIRSINSPNKFYETYQQWLCIPCFNKNEKEGK